MGRSRRGSFGLQPRVAPNVSGQIVALAREYVAKRDALIMDAWRNGGTFEGKKATDDMVLAYWKDRGKDLDPEDPEYEQSKDQVMQLEYAVAQSKADVLHVQGKLSDLAYAQFFLKWAKKVPGNSEFYRTLQKDAAQLIEQAKNNSRINGERAKTEAFNAFVKTTTSRDIAIGDAMTAALTDLSKATGLSIAGNGDELLSLLTQNVKANPDQYRALLDTIKAGDKGWDGQLTEGYFTAHIKSATQGYELIADRAQKGGFMSAYKNATDGAAAMSQWGQNLKVWPVAQSYTTAENAFLKVWNDPNASQMDKQAAAGAFSAQLTQMAGTPGIDAGSKTMIEADAQRLLGQDAGDNPSFGTSMIGRAGIDPKMTAQLGLWSQVSLEMQANPLAWAYGPVDAHGQYDPTGRGPLGMVPAGAIPPGAQAVMVPGADGKAVLAMVMPHSVYTTNPNNPTASPQLAGYQISYNVGGRVVQMWGYKDARGGNHWSLTSPLTEGAGVATDSKGDVYVTPNSSAATDPIARAEQLDAQLGTHIADQLRAQQKVGAPLGGVHDKLDNIDPKTGHNLGSVELKYDNGVFTATQNSNVLDKDGHILETQGTPLDITVNSPQAAAFSASRLAAGDVANVTFNSPLQASVKAATYNQTADQVSRFASDPAFQQAFLSQTMQTLGVTNPFDARINDAWKSITTATAADEPTYAPSSHAGNRTDLQYPGVQRNPVTGATPSIHYGTGEIRLPGLPPTSPAAALFGGLATNVASTLMDGSLLPGLGIPPQQAAGSPTPTVPGVTPTPTPTISTTPAPTTVDPAKPPVSTAPPAKPLPAGSGGYSSGGGRRAV